LTKFLNLSKWDKWGLCWKKWHLSDINELCLKCNDLSFNFLISGILLTDYTLYHLLHAHRVCSGCLILPNMYTPVISAEQYWLLRLLHFPSLPFSEIHKFFSENCFQEIYVSIILLCWQNKCINMRTGTFKSNLPKKIFIYPIWNSKRCLSSLPLAGVNKTSRCLTLSINILLKHVFHLIWFGNIKGQFSIIVNSSNICTMFNQVPENLMYVNWMASGNSVTVCDTFTLGLWQHCVLRLLNMHKT
jgi:hypothetical protein